jgi:O-antigen ligase
MEKASELARAEKSILSQSLLNRSPSQSTFVKPAATAAGDWSGRCLLGIWILVAALTPLSGFFGARGFAPEVGIAGFLCLPFVRLRLADAAGLILFGLLVEWALISALWSPAPLPHDLNHFGRFTGLHMAQELLFSGALIATARALSPERAGKALLWVGGGLMVLIAALVFESLTDAWLLGTLQGLAGEKPRVAHWALRTVGQGAYVVVMLFWPVSVGLWAAGRRRLAAAFAGAAALALVLLHISAPLAAIITGAAVFGLVVWLGRPAVIGMLVLSVAQIFAVPWLMRLWAQDGVFTAMLPHLPASWAARVNIWTFVTERMAEKPVFGWGLDASRTFKGHIPLHPHDAALQLWFELGAIGALLGALVWAFIFWRFAEAAPRRRLYAAAGCATAWSALVIGAFSFSLWQEWWICLAALGFAACALLARQLDGSALLQRSGSPRKRAPKQRSGGAKGDSRG